MLTADVMELLDKLLTEDGQMQETLSAKLTEVEKRLEEVNAQLTKAEAYSKAKTSLAENQAKEEEKVAALKVAQEVLAAAQETLPEQELLGKQINEIDLLLPSYDELSEKATDLSKNQTDLETAQNAEKTAQESILSLTGEITAMKAERKELDSVSAAKSYLALSKILHSDMRDFFQTDFGKEYYQKWLKEHGKNKPKYTQYDYKEDEDE